MKQVIKEVIDLILYVLFVLASLTTLASFLVFMVNCTLVKLWLSCLIIGPVSGFIIFKVIERVNKYNSNFTH